MVTALSADALHLQAGRDDELRVPWNAPERERREVVVWGDTVLADDAGDEAAAWFSAVLGQACRLVGIGGSSRRELPERRIPEITARSCGSACRWRSAMRFRCWSFPKNRSLISIAASAERPGSP